MKKLNLREVEDRLNSLNIKIFSTHDVISIFEVEERTAQAFLAYNTNKGFLVRLKPGLFAVKRNFPDNYVIANRIYGPSYISLETALSHHHLIPESVYAITSVTTKSTREFEINGILFDYRKIKNKVYTGYVPYKAGFDNAQVFIATPEKAVADFLYFVYLGKKNYNDRLKINKINQEILFNYLNLYASQQLTQFTKKILQKYD